jgi:hypothetical protein
MNSEPECWLCDEKYDTELCAFCEKCENIICENCYTSKNNKEYCNKCFNKGIGAGGKKTNKHGLSYEEKITNKIIDNLGIIKHKEKFGKCKNDIITIVIINDKEYKLLVKKGLEHYIKPSGKCSYHPQPDICFVNEKTIYILEIKFQSRAGSVDEKIQTSSIKKALYEDLYEGYKIKYAYILNDWFKKYKYTSVIKHINVPVFFGDDDFIDDFHLWLHL